MTELGRTETIFSHWQRPLGSPGLKALVCKSDTFAPELFYLVTKTSGITINAPDLPLFQETKLQLFAANSLGAENNLS